MGQRRAEPAAISQAGDSESPGKISQIASWLVGSLPVRRRSALVAAGLIALILVVCAGVVRELGTNAQPAGAARAGSAKATPAFSAAEEAYVWALWPIHGDVERTAVRVSLGTIFYKTGDLGRVELKDRLEAALVTYRKAEARISELEPPPSFVRGHRDYLAAIRLYEQAAVEALKMFSDGDDEHLVLAHPLSQEGSNKIREIGGRFWRDEFPPN
jgi:hypothetical protein